MAQKINTLQYHLPSIRHPGVSCWVNLDVNIKDTYTEKPI